MMNFLKDLKSKQWRQLVRAAAFLLGLALHGQSVAAVFSCTTSMSTLTFALPSGTYAVPRDAPVGTLISPFTSLQTVPNVWTCDVLQPGTYFGPATQSVLSPDGRTYTFNGYSYNVYQTNVPGVGMAIGMATAFPEGGWTPLGPVSTQWKSGYTLTSTGMSTGLKFGIALNFAYIKTGPIAGGVVSFAGPIGQAGMAQMGVPAGVSNVVQMVASGSTTFRTLACTTPNVTVDLGSHKNTEFSGVGTYTSSTGFNIALNNCPAGINSVTYQLDATTNIIDASNSVVQLDGSSTAAGVGVQLLDNSGNVLPLGTARTLSGYSTSTGGSYTIALKARYYQTGSTVTAGTADSEMTFTMIYQ